MSSLATAQSEQSQGSQQEYRAQHPLQVLAVNRYFERDLTVTPDHAVGPHLLRQLVFENNMYVLIPEDAIHKWRDRVIDRDPVLDEGRNNQNGGARGEKQQRAPHSLARA